MTDRNNIIKLNSQLLFLDKRLVFWIKFYLLNDPFFRSAFLAEYESLLNEFRLDPKYMGLIPMDFDRFLNSNNQGSFLNSLNNLIDTESFVDKDIIKKAFNSELVQQYDRKMLGRIVADNLAGKDDLKELFLFLRNSISNKSFYSLSFIEIEQIIGNWISTKETDQLRINYNMTDLSPIGSQVRLLIEKYNNEFYSFQCFAKASDFINDEVGEIRVFETRVKVEEGYINHYHISDLTFLYKRPIYGFNNNTFITQTDKIEFVFERINNI
jgi:hypothetical protein